MTMSGAGRLFLQLCPNLQSGESLRKIADFTYEGGSNATTGSRKS